MKPDSKHFWVRIDPDLGSVGSDSFLGQYDPESVPKMTQNLIRELLVETVWSDYKIPHTFVFLVSLIAHVECVHKNILQNCTTWSVIKTVFNVQWRNKTLPFGGGA